MTELIFILDRSGSMAGLEADTIGGFNALLEKQKSESGRVLVSTLLFDDKLQTLHDRLPLESIPAMTREDYFVRGSTALLDALGSAIEHIRTIHKYARPEDVPQRTLFVITTDGMENASRRYRVDQVRRMITAQKEMGWEFLFLGANIDAVETAGHFGIAPEHAVDYCSDAQGTALNYEVLSQAVSAVREARPLTASWKSRIERDFKKRRK